MCILMPSSSGVVFLVLLIAESNSGKEKESFQRTLEFLRSYGIPGKFCYFQCFLLLFRSHFSSVLVLKNVLCFISSGVFGKLFIIGLQY